MAHRTHYYHLTRDDGFTNIEIVGRVFVVNVGLVALAALSVVDVTVRSSAAALIGVGHVAWLTEFLRACASMSARVLVTGASGFVGRALVDSLVGAGYRVRATTRQPGEATFPTSVEMVTTCDYRRPVDWAPLLAGVNSVVHLAGIAHIGPAFEEAEYDRVVHAATAELVAACSKAGVRRFVFMSSVRAQSGPAAAGVLTENDAPRPTESYGGAKLRAEAAVRGASVPWTILRPTMVYGAGAKGNFARLRRIADSPWPLPFAGLANKRSLVSLDNLISAVLFVLNADVAARQVYLVADPTPVTLPQTIAALRCGLGRAPRLYPAPPTMFAHMFRLIGRSDVWERVGGTLVVDAGKLIAAGWKPDADTLGTLARIAGQHGIAALANGSARGCANKAQLSPTK